MLMLSNCYKICPPNNIYMYHNVAALFNRYLRTMKPVAMMTVTMTIAQKTKTPLMKITTMSQIQTNLLVKIGQTWKGKQKKMTKSMKTKKGEVTNLHTDHHTKTGQQKIPFNLSLKIFPKINIVGYLEKNINCIIFLLIFRSPQKSRHGSSHHSSSRNGHHSSSKDKHSSSHSDKRKRDRDSSSGGKHSKSPKKMRSRRQ